MSTDIPHESLPQLVQCPVEDARLKRQVPFIAAAMNGLVDPVISKENYREAVYRLAKDRMPWLPTEENGAPVKGALLDDAVLPIAWKYATEDIRRATCLTLCQVEALWMSLQQSVVADLTSELLCIVETTAGGTKEIRCLADDGLVEKFQAWIDQKIALRRSLPLQVSAVAIREPFKVRIITKGPEYEYYRCLDYQKIMHRALKKHPVFEWIGSPISEERWESTFGFFAKDPQDRKMVSGDYEAATDNLNPSLSRYVWKQICKVVRRTDGSTLITPNVATAEYALEPYSPEYDLGLRCLVGHTLCWTEKGKKGTASKQCSMAQAWGQLMGSPMSFPILCIANAACCLHSLGYDGTDLTVPVRVNGDDCAFAATDDELHLWESVTAEAGLKKSVGKNYYSANFCVMNSEIRRISNGHWHYDGYVNQGLLRGLIRKGTEAGQSADLAFSEVGSNLERALRGIADSASRDRLIQIGIKNHQEILQQAPQGVSWWTPVEFGGLGLPCRDRQQAVTSRPFADEALTVAAYLSSSGAIASARPTPSREKGALAVALAKLRSMIPSRPTPKRLIKDDPCLLDPVLPRQQHALLSGKPMLRFLLGIPSTIPRWDSSLGVTDNRRLAKEWQAGLAPGKRLYQKFIERKDAYSVNYRDHCDRVASGVPSVEPGVPLCAFHPIDLGAEHVEWASRATFSLARTKSSRWDVDCVPLRDAHSGLEYEPSCYLTGCDSSRSGNRWGSSSPTGPSRDGVQLPILKEYTFSYLDLRRALTV